MLTAIREAMGTQSVDIDAILHSQRFIFIDDVIDEKMASSVTKQLLLYAIFDSSKTVKIIINSSGGSIHSGLVIYDLMRSANLNIETYCVGKAHSMAAVICAAGSRRYILPNSSMMLHEPLFDSKLKTSISSFNELAKNLLKTKEQLYDILSKLTHQPLQTIESITQYDCLFNAEAAVEFGLVDEICGFEKIVEGLHYDSL